MSHTTLVLAAALLLLVACVAARDLCLPDRLAVYRLVLDTHWTRDRFPKQFPEWRPPAQWSKLVGRSHDKSFVLFRVGKSASEGLQMFAETGQSDGLETLSQTEAGVFDEFGAPPVPSGQGRTETEFFADGNHTRVSAVVRIVPSPDWFIGLDSLDLCKGGFWIDTVAIQMGPMDAGTDNGFTFTSPNWLSEPRQKVFHITAKYPDHPANSFYYPELKHLPPIATFHFFKEKVYQLSEKFHHSPPSPSKVYTVEDLQTALHRDEISNDVAPIYTSSINTRQHRLHKHRRLRTGGRRPIPCHVSDWGAWSPCSVSCGVGESSRSRKVVRQSRRGGRPCPPLAETRWCGGHTDCPEKFFNW